MDIRRIRCNEMHVTEVTEADPSRVNWKVHVRSVMNVWIA